MEIEYSGEAEKAILICYREFMTVQPGMIPTVAQIYQLVKYYMDVQCYDLTFPEVFQIMSKDLVAQILDKNKYVHKREGITMYEAQNVLFDNWFYSDRLLKGDVDGNQV